MEGNAFAVEAIFDFDLRSNILKIRRVGFVSTNCFEKVQLSVQGYGGDFTCWQ